MCVHVYIVVCLNMCMHMYWTYMKSSRGLSPHSSTNVLTHALIIMQASSHCVYHGWFMCQSYIQLFLCALNSPVICGIICASA